MSKEQEKPAFFNILGKSNSANLEISVNKGNPLFLDGSVTPMKVVPLCEIDNILSEASVSHRDITFLQEDKSGASSFELFDKKRVNLSKLGERYTEGATIRISNIQKYSERISDMCLSLQTPLTHVEADLWITRKSNVQPNLHFDAEDIFIFQVSGKKQWQLYSFNECDLVEKKVGQRLNLEDVGELISKHILNPGDFLYVPAGTPHLVSPLTRDSVHVGVGVHRLSWRTLLQSVIERTEMIPSGMHKTIPLSLFDSGSLEKNLKDGLTTVFNDALAKVDMQWVLGSIKREYMMRSITPKDKHFSKQILSQMDLTESSKVQKRLNIVSCLYELNGLIHLEWSLGGEFIGPEAMRETLHFIATEKGVFLIRNLPGNLEDGAKLLLIQALIDRGLLFVPDDSAE